MRSSWIVLMLILAFMLGSCTVLTGNGSHWPSSLAAVLVLVPLKLLNDRHRFLAWPMEFLLASGVVFIALSLVRLYVTPIVY